MTTILVMLAAAALAGPNDTVAQRNAWAEYERALDAKIDKVNTTCGSKLTGSYDQRSYPSFDPIQDRTQSACQQAVDTLGPICATPAGKAAVQNLKATSCRFSTTGTGVKVHDGTLVISIDPAKSTIVGEKPGSYNWKSAIEEKI